jgi:diguanylate cyclase (GGDEF)-like protein
MDEAKRIYIADDETNIRLAIKAFLENAGYIVNDYENGDLLLEAFTAREADLVILDVMMPGSNGFVICKELRKISHVPIFMLTARDSDLDYATGLDIGSDDYLTKPFSPMALVMRVKAIFRRLDFERNAYERDAMTGLYNKISGIRYVKNELKVRDDKAVHALFVIDIDNFKDVNDTFGHAFGDKVIVEFADTIAAIFRDSDIVFRFGGDEFVAFAVNISDPNYAEQKAVELNDALRKHCSEDDAKCGISASIGIACFPFHGLTYDTLFQNADSAVYITKQNGKDGYTVFSDDTR